MADNPQLPDPLLLHARAPLPNVEYPPHTHAGIEELHLLDGELWIDDRKLRPVLS